MLPPPKKTYHTHHVVPSVPMQCSQTGSNVRKNTHIESRSYISYKSTKKLPKIGWLCSLVFLWFLVCSSFLRTSTPPRSPPRSSLPPSPWPQREMEYTAAPLEQKFTRNHCPSPRQKEIKKNNQHKSTTTTATTTTTTMTTTRLFLLWENFIQL